MNSFLNDKCPSMTGRAFGDRKRTAYVLFCIRIILQNIAPRNLKGGCDDPKS